MNFRTMPLHEVVRFAEYSANPRTMQAARRELVRAHIHDQLDTQQEERAREDELDNAHAEGYTQGYDEGYAQAESDLEL